MLKLCFVLISMLVLYSLSQMQILHLLNNVLVKKTLKEGFHLSDNVAMPTVCYFIPEEHNNYIPFGGKRISVTFPNFTQSAIPGFHIDVTFFSLTIYFGLNADHECCVWFDYVSRIRQTGTNT